MKVTAALVLAAVVLVSCSSQPSELVVDEDSGAAADYSFTIPPGAGEALDRGEPLEVLPGAMEVRVGEVIEIVNTDDRGHLVGPFFVGAGETLRQRFASPGEYVGICTVHPSGQLVLTIVEP